MRDSYDIVVVGGGPAGSAAAWRAAQAGASVLVVDRAKFPRDKPCGDGLSGRALKWIDKMGLTESIAHFPEVSRYRLNWRGRSFSGTVPSFHDDRPAYTRIVSREVLDEILLRNAERAGADVVENAAVRVPVVEDGVVRGVEVSVGGGAPQTVRSSVTVGCDGMSSRVGRSLGMVPRPSHPYGVVIRAQVDTNHYAADHVEFHVLEVDGKPIVGYGWVFPMGNGRLNIGVGYSSKQRGSDRINVRALFRSYLDVLPRDWGVPSYEVIEAGGMLKGWRLPVGMAVWPPWRPGVLLAGDAAGVAEPFAGAGISRALESGVAAGAFAAAAANDGDPADLSGYAKWLHRSWSGQYRVGRGVHAAFSHPTILAGFFNASVALGRLPKVLWHVGTDSYGMEEDRFAELFAKALLWVGERIPGDDPEVTIAAALDEQRERAFRRPRAKVSPAVASSGR